jgi:hypothetical protein
MAATALFIAVVLAGYVVDLAVAMLPDERADGWLVHYWRYTVLPQLLFVSALGLILPAAIAVRAWLAQLNNADAYLGFDVANETMTVEGLELDPLVPALVSVASGIVPLFALALWLVVLRKVLGVDFGGSIAASRGYFFAQMRDPPLWDWAIRQKFEADNGGGSGGIPSQCGRPPSASNLGSRMASRMGSRQGSRTSVGKWSSSGLRGLSNPFPSRQASRQSSVTSLKAGAAARMANFGVPAKRAQASTSADNPVFELQPSNYGSLQRVPVGRDTSPSRSPPGSPSLLRQPTGVQRRSPPGSPMRQPTGVQRRSPPGSPMRQPTGVQRSASAFTAGVSNESSTQRPPVLSQEGGRFVGSRLKQPTGSARSLSPPRVQTPPRGQSPPPRVQGSGLEQQGSGKSMSRMCSAMPPGVEKAGSRVRELQRLKKLAIESRVRRDAG